jgi:hypothetical protein
MNSKHGLFSLAASLMITCLRVTSGSAQITHPKALDVKRNVGKFITMSAGKTNLNQQQYLFNQSDGPNDFLLYGPSYRPYLNLSGYPRIEVRSKKPDIDLLISRVNTDSLILINGFRNLDLEYGNMGYTSFEAEDISRYRSLSIIHVGFKDAVDIQTDTVDNLSCEADTFQDLDISKVTILYNSHISGRLNGRLDLSSFSAVNGAVLDIRGLNKPKGHLISVNLKDAHLESINVSYDSISVYIGDTTSVAEIRHIYTPILKRLKDLGDDENYKVYYIREKQLLSHAKPVWPFRLVDAFNRIFWNYGLDTWMLIYWTMILFGVFLFVNLLSLKFVIEEYALDNISNRYIEIERDFTRYSLGRFFNKLVLCAVFTANIFFGLKFEVEKITFKRPHVLLWIVIDYTTGLLCLVYIVHYYFTTA